VILLRSRETPRTPGVDMPGVDGGTVRELHVVAVSEDGRHVVLAARKGATKGEFRVPLDERLSAAVRGDLPRPGEAEPAVVTPKEIQSRLRAGESPEEIAASAGVPVSKIERYAGPVLSERERVLDQARAGFVTRSRLGESSLPLGEAVARHLSETTGVRLETVSWSTRREESGTWLVELAYVSQARRRGATWRYDGVRREVTAVDSLAAALAHVDGSGRRSRAADPEPFSAPPARAGSRTAARRAAPVRSARTATAPRAAKPAKPAKAPAARTAAAPVRAAAPVPRAAAPTKAAQTAASRSAAATAARATTARAAAQERAARAAAAEAARAAAQAQEAADAQARAAQARAAKQAADRAAKASAARAAKAAAAKAAKALAAKAAQDKAAAQKAAKERAAQQRADRAAADKAAKQAAREQAAADKAAAQQAAQQAARDEAARLEAEQAAREAEQAPTGPPTLRVVGAQDAPVRRGPKEPPAAARTAPARVAGQRASVPGWADVLLSTAPLARPESEPDTD
jgi:hypothetical protein